MRRHALLLGTVVLASVLASPRAGASVGMDSGLIAARATSAGAIVTFPVGNPADPLNTFYQSMSTAGGPWSLTTPVNIATNGGLLTAMGPHGATAIGVLPSQQLTSSPLSLAHRPLGPFLPGFSPSPLSFGADALSTSASSVTEVTSAGLLEESADGLRWRRLTPSTGLLQAKRRCGGTFVAITTEPVLVVGMSCRHSGAPLASASGPISITGLSVGGGPWRCLRLEGTDKGIEALLVGPTSHGARRYVVVEGTPSHLEVGGQLVVKGTGASLRATAIGPRGQVAIVVGSSVDELSPAQRVLPRLAHLAAVAFTPAGQLEALAIVNATEVSGGNSTLTFNHLEGSRWRAIQVVSIVVPWGSSN